MPDFVLLDDQNVDCAVQIQDDAGNIVTGESLDAGSVTATAALADGSDASATVQVTVSADQSSVNVKALGPPATGVVITPAATLNGSALTGKELVIDVNPSPATQVALVPGTPQHN